MPDSRTEAAAPAAARYQPDASDELARLGHALRALGIDDEWATSRVRAADERAESVAPIIALRERLVAGNVISPGSVLLERWLLVRAAHRHAPGVDALAVPADVKARFHEEFAYYAAPDDGALRHLVAGRYNFAAACKVATLRRFPAGDCHWELSGLPRSLLLRLAPRDMPRVAAFVAARMRGFRPMFFPHLAWRRKNRFMLLESEMYRSYHRMARAMALQPAVKGLVAAAWFYSPDTFAVTPHLAWMSRIFEQHGGLVARVGPAHPDSGVFEGGGMRKRLYDEGKFKPTSAMVLWPRAAMLAWAAAHPHYGE